MGVLAHRGVAHGVKGPGLGQASPEHAHRVAHRGFAIDWDMVVGSRNPRALRALLKVFPVSPG